MVHVSVDGADAAELVVLIREMTTGRVGPARSSGTPVLPLPGWANGHGIRPNGGRAMSGIVLAVIVIVGVLFGALCSRRNDLRRKAAPGRFPERYGPTAPVRSACCRSS